MHQNPGRLFDENPLLLAARGAAVTPAMSGGAAPPQVPVADTVYRA